MRRIEKTFLDLAERDEGALIPYLTVGYPTADETLPLVQAICEAGADVVELGVPFSDPVADGPTIRQASQVALRNGTSVHTALRLVQDLRRSGLDTPLILFGYCNPFRAYGVERLIEDAAEAGVDGLIVPDLPPEQAADWLPSVQAHGLDLIFFLSPITSQKRLRLVLNRGSGFIYCISVTGVTGARERLSTDLNEYLSRVRDTTELPVAVGFGISTPEHVREVCGMAEGAIVGSALIKVISEHDASDRVEAVRAYITELKKATLRPAADRQLSSARQSRGER